MSYFAVYAMEGDEPTQDGEQIATGTGWANFGSHVLDSADDYPETAHLAQEGWWEPGEEGADWGTIEHELETITQADDPNTASVARSLLEAVKARPQGAAGLVVTDGTDPDDDEDEDEEGRS